MESTAASVVIFFVGFGFLSSYLLTRMFIGPAFLLADQATHSGIAYDAGRTALALTQVNADINGAMEELGKEPAPAPARTDQLIALLQAHHTQFPLNRRLHIVLGRLYRIGKGDLPAAIRVLSQFVRDKKKAGQRDNDLADALFNIACYYSLQLKSAKDEASRLALVREGMKAVEESVAVSPENIEDLQTDAQLEDLRNSEAWKIFIAERQKDTGKQKGV